MIAIKITTAGGRRVYGDTSLCKFSVEWDSNGKLVSEVIEICEPKTRINTLCKERGEMVGEEECETCNGNVRLKVFACSLHVKCTITHQIPNIACCATCSDYQKKE